jgi:hypothetical protein
MSRRWASLLWALGGFVTGALPAFALAATSFFADGPFSERLYALAAYAGVLFVLGVAAGALSRRNHAAAAIGLGLPVLPCLLLLASAGSLAMYLLGAAFTVVAFAAPWGGSAVGAGLSAARTARDPR